MYDTTMINSTHHHRCSISIYSEREGLTPETYRTCDFFRIVCDDIVDVCIATNTCVAPDRSVLIQIYLQARLQARAYVHIYIYIRIQMHTYMLVKTCMWVDVHELSSVYMRLSTALLQGAAEAIKSARELVCGL